MNKEHIRKLFNNGILKAWLDGKTLQYSVNDEWIDVVYSSCVDDLSGLNLRIKPESIKQTLEWFSFADSEPNKPNTTIIFSRNNQHTLVKLNSKKLYSTIYDGYESVYTPIDIDYWAYIESPSDVPF